MSPILSLLWYPFVYFLGFLSCQALLETISSAYVLDTYYKWRRRGLLKQEYTGELIRESAATLVTYFFFAGLPTAWVLLKWHTEKEITILLGFLHALTLFKPMFRNKKCYLWRELRDYLDWDRAEDLSKKNGYDLDELKHARDLDKYHNP